MNRIALITGISSGIGAGLSVRLAGAGFDIIGTYNRNLAGATSVKQEVMNTGRQCIIHQVDVTSEKSVLTLVKELDQKNSKHIDVLIHNAGVDMPTPLESTSLEDWANITRIKTDGHFLMTKWILKFLKESMDPNIVFISSSLDQRPDPEDPAYSVASAATGNFARSMAIALSKYRIRVNVVTPGSIKTNLQHWRQLLTSNPALFDTFASKNPLGRNVTIDDIARAVLFLVDDPGHFLNGNNIFVNGGTHLVTF